MIARNAPKYVKQQAARPNPERRARKPVYGGWPHLGWPRGTFLSSK